MKQLSFYTRFAKASSQFCGKPIVFILAIFIIVLWIVSGPIFHFSDTWQLVINTGTTIITFLMVFLIQNTQYRDTEAIHMKLDELIRVTKGAHNSLINLEENEEETIAEFRKKYETIANLARENSQKGILDTEAVEL